MAGLQFFGEKVFRLDLNESRECFCRRGRGRSSDMLMPTKTAGAEQTKAREPTVENLEAESIRSGMESRLREGL